MDKQQAFYNLWSQFGIPAYDENSVPDNAQFPYITYQVVVDDLDYPVSAPASIWYRGDSWEPIDLKLIQITGVISRIKPIALDEGYMYITKGSPWAQRMSDETDKMVKRYVLNPGIEFLTSN